MLGAVVEGVGESVLIQCGCVSPAPVSADVFGDARNL